MLQPQEIEVWYILPAIRKELAKELLKERISQRKIADLMGIRKSAVSQYLSGKRAHVKLGKEILDEIKKSSKRISSNKADCFNEIQRICQLIRQKKVICKISIQLGKAPAGCKRCFEKRK